MPENSSDMLLGDFENGRHVHCLQCIAVPPLHSFLLHLSLLRNNAG